MPHFSSPHLITMFNNHSKKENEKRPRVVVLGSGWAAMSTIRKLHADKYHVTVVSPRNFFLFTPMLAGSTTGLVEHRSIIEPVRKIMERSDASHCKYVQAECVDVDLVNNSIKCVDPSSSTEFRVDYDMLVVAVGCTAATFGIKGVEQYGEFMKELSDSRRIRDKLQDCFETASLPGQSEQEKKRLLHFCVVGAGPSGVEFCGELDDFVREDLSSTFPSLKQHVKITLIEALPNILTMFDRKLANFAQERLLSDGVEVKTSTMVTEVDARHIHLKGGSSIEYGMLVWVAGITARPITNRIIELLGPQNQSNRNGLKVDKHFLVHGTSNVYAIGDCSLSGNPPTAQVAAQEGIYLARMFNALSDTYHSRDKASISSAVASYSPFSYRHFGNFAYIGGNKAIGQLNPGGDKDNEEVQLKGEGVFYLWRSVYLSKLLSPRNRTLVAIDWLKAKIFGRDISRT